MIPEILLLELFTTSVAVLLLGRWRRVVEITSVGAVLFSAALSLLYALQLQDFPCVVLQFYTDALSKIMLCVVNVLGALIVTYSIGYMKNEASYRRYYSLMLLFIASMSMLVLATDLIVLYLSWELVGVCSALLISFWWDKPEARRAGLKAFTVTRIGDIGLVVAIALILSAMGTSSIPSILGSLDKLGGETTMIALLLILAAIGKSAQFPLFVWLPDAMEGPTSVSALIHAATMVKAGVYLVSRLYPLIASSTTALEFILITSIITILISAISALGASDIKKVLAYSTINHLALMFLALGVGAWSSAQLHLLSHSLFKALLFLCAGLIIHEASTRSLDELSGLWSAGLRVTSIAFLIGSLSLAGVPPFPGYFTKELIFYAFEHHFPTELSILFTTIVSLLSSLYIFRLYFRVFSGSSKNRMHEKDLAMMLPIIILSVLTLGGYFILLQASRMLGVQTIYSDVNPYAILGLVVGFLTSYLIWRKGSFSALRITLTPLSRIADNGFYLDAAYRFIATHILDFASRLSQRLQTGIPSVNTLWLIGLLVFLTIIVLGVM